MARPWRLRHKLVIGLALVVGGVGLLLGGTLFGLSAYMRTMRATNRKLDESQIAVQLRDRIHDIGTVGPADEKAQILDRIEKAKHTLKAYRITLEDQAVRHGLDLDDGDHELALAARLDVAFARLSNDLEEATKPGVDPEPGKPLIERAAMRGAYADLNQLSTDLFRYIISDVKESFVRSEANHRRSLSVVGSASVFVVVLVATLLHYFRVWVFSPIGAIQAGVRRVHAGNFDKPIRLDSHDELQELADEFNAMAARMLAVQRDLVRQVEERSQQLVAAEKMVTVGFLAAGVAHEINNPLASIAFCAEALERRLEHLLDASPGADADVIRKYLGMIQQEAFRCKQITERLLDYSRTGSGRWEPTDLGGLVQNVLELVQHLPASRGKRLVFRPDVRVVAAIDANEVQGLVNNLVVNALENTDEGGTVQIGLRAAGDAAELTVRDTGCGMSADTLAHLFEPFYTRSRTGKGTGLGLFISQKVATQHGGAITAASDGPGKGSTFSVRLPIRSSEARQGTGDMGHETEETRVTIPMPGVRVAA